MKRRAHLSRSSALILAVLLLSGGFATDLLSQATNNSPAEETATATPPAPSESNPDSDVVTAPAKPISTAKPLPATIRTSSPMAEAVKLADSGVDESVMLAFVNNSTSTFNLGADEIIYLNDLGFPSAVVSAMIQRDQALKASMASAGGAPTAPPPVPAEPAPAAPEPPPAPAPADMAPQPDNTADTYPPPADNTYATFYDPLAPYGTWLDVAGYGPCWQPSVVVVSPGWQPYCNGGRWVYTDCGWYWLSDYSWGWAPFHYGRWFRHNQYGWCWMPGNVWGPSWVSWRYGGYYCGWAPLPPAAGYNSAFGLTYHGQHVSGSFGFGLGVRSYTFVELGHFPDRHVSHWAVPHHQATHIYNTTMSSTTIVGNGNQIVNHGIPVSHVATASHTQIHPIGIHDLNAAGPHGTRAEQLQTGSHSLSVFRPQFSQSPGVQPAAGARPGSDLRRTGGHAPIMPAASPSRTAPVQSPRNLGNSPAARPGSSGGSGSRSDLSPSSPNAAAQTLAGSAPTRAQPLILRGPDRSGETANRTGASPFNHAPSLSSQIVRGNSQDASSQPMSQTSATSTEFRPKWPTASAPANPSRPEAAQQMRPFTTPATDVQSPAKSSWPTPRPGAFSAVGERPSQPAAPAVAMPTTPSRAQPFVASTQFGASPSQSWSGRGSR